MGSTINSCRSALLGPNPLRHQRRFQRRRRSCDVYAVFIPVRFPWQESKFPNYLLVQIVKFRLNVLLLLPLIRFSTLVAVAMDADHKQPAHHFITTHQGSLVWGGGRLAAPSDHWRRRRHTHTHTASQSHPRSQGALVLVTYRGAFALSPKASAQSPHSSRPQPPSRMPPPPPQTAQLFPPCDSRSIESIRTQNPPGIPRQLIGIEATSRSAETKWVTGLQGYDATGGMIIVQTALYSLIKHNVLKTNERSH